MAKSVYIETTVVSYLTSRPSRDLVKAAHQQVTREWWEGQRARFDVFSSEIVMQEAADGDREAAAKRLALLDGMPLLRTTDLAGRLAQSLLDERALPAEADVDALHIAVAAAHGMDILLTWNCRYIANGEIIGAVSRVLWSKGYVPPAICTPDELMGGQP